MISTRFLLDFLYSDLCFHNQDFKTYKLCRLIWHIKMLIGIIYDLLHGILFIMWNTDRVSNKDFYHSQAKGVKQSNPVPLLNYCLVDKCRSVTQFSKYHMRPRKNEFECHVLVKAFVHSNEHLNLKNIQNDVFKIVLFRQKLTLF